MYDDYLKKYWVGQDPVKPINTEMYKEESLRWAELMDYKNKDTLRVNPLRYGKLSIRGFIQVLGDQYISKYENQWPSTPADIVELLLACNLQEGDLNGVVNAIIRTEHGSERFKKATNVYVLALKRLGIEVSTQKMIDFTEKLTTKDMLESEFASLYTAIAQHTSLEEDAFLRKALSSITEQPEEKSEDGVSRGTFLAALFVENDGTDLVQWCGKTKDYRGLAYLVWQGRCDIVTWLHEVAPLVEEGDTQKNTDIYNMLKRLTEKLGQEELARLSTFSQLYPNDSEKLAKWSVSNEYGDENKKMRNELHWYGTLLALGVLNEHDEKVNTWLNNSLRKLESWRQQLDAERYPWEAMYIESGWMQKWGASLVSQSKAAATLLARHTILNIERRGNDALVEELATSWTKDLEIENELLSQYKKNKKGFITKLVKLLPSLPKESVPKIGAEIVQACNTGAINTTTVRSTWKSKDKERFGATIPSSYQGSSLILFALTRENPNMFLETLATLGIEKTTDTYTQIIEDWLRTTLSTNTAPLQQHSLPELKTNH